MCKVGNPLGATGHTEKQFDGGVHEHEGTRLHGIGGNSNMMRRCGNNMPKHSSSPNTPPEAPITGPPASPLIATR